MFNRILVSIDGSDPANHALGYAANLAAMDEAELIVLSVCVRAVRMSYRLVCITNLFI